MFNPIFLSSPHSAPRQPGATIWRNRARGAVTLTRFSFLLACFVLFLATAGDGRATENASPVEFTARDTTGADHFAAEKNAQATVWLFVAHDCPICNSYAPEVARLIADYTSRHVRINLVYAESGLALAALTAHAREHGYQADLFSEGDGRLARACGVTITPEAAVVDAKGFLAYRGRIDNRYVTLGHERREITSHDLRAALDAILAGQPVPSPRTQAIGCAFSPANPP